MANGATIQRVRHSSFAAIDQPASTLTVQHLERLSRKLHLLIWSSIAFLLFGIAVYLGLLEALFPPPTLSSQPVYLIFPYSVAYFLPLLIPLTTYIVIARWTGEKHFRHS